MKPIEIRSASGRKEAIHFGRSGRPLFGFYHPPAEGAWRGTGVVLCSPIGTDHTRSDRTYRHLAEQARGEPASPASGSTSWAPATPAAKRTPPGSCAHGSTTSAPRSTSSALARVPRAIAARRPAPGGHVWPASTPPSEARRRLPRPVEPVRLGSGLRAGGHEAPQALRADRAAHREGSPAASGRSRRRSGRSCRVRSSRISRRSISCRPPASRRGAPSSSTAGACLAAMR